jgi:hypothetical protein
MVDAKKTAKNDPKRFPVVVRSTPEHLALRVLGFDCGGRCNIYEEKDGDAYRAGLPGEISYHLASTSSTYRLAGGAAGVLIEPVRAGYDSPGEASANLESLLAELPPATADLLRIGIAAHCAGTLAAYESSRQATRGEWRNFRKFLRIRQGKNFTLVNPESDKLLQRWT